MLNAAGDQKYMACATALSERGRGRTGANPNVGCVIVKNGRIVGRGWTQAGGRPHAEEMALAAAGDAARGADVYVTLEPCAHQSARGPTCSTGLINIQPARVIIAALDADPRTHGVGIKALKDAGITVTTDILAPAARRAMAGFFSRIERGRPHVTLKLAMSLDGRIALNDGSSKWITGDRARAHGHLARARSDAILVGAGTVKADQPRLDVRLDGLADRSPQPLMLGKAANLPEHWQHLPRPAAIFDLDGINWLLIEGGAKAAAAFIAEDLVDRLLIYRAPILVGDGLAALSDIGLSDLPSAHGRWRSYDRRQWGPDRLEIFERAA